MPESDLPAEPAGCAWAFGEPVTLRLSLGDGAAERQQCLSFSHCIHPSPGDAARLKGWLASLGMGA